MLKQVTLTIAAGLIAGVAFAADTPDTPFHNGTANIIEPGDESNPLGELISGYDFRQPEVREMQDDEFSNPGMLTVEHGMDIWEMPDGSKGKSMADIWKKCSGVDAEEAGAVYPRYHDGAGKVISLEQQINYCREKFMGAEPYKWEKADMLGMTAFIRYMANGKPVKVDISGPAATTFKKGEKLYYTRLGQLDVACAHCHETNYGSYIRADMLSQGHTNGFPTYRVKWNGIGSAQRRFRGCNNNIRATRLPYGHEDYVALELYLAWRGSGLPVETPSVRQ
ncbi:MAG: sulfur oxidation c-type cytochrome SoxA [Parvularculales bacterium]